MGMSNFNEKDLEKIKKWGNAAAKKHWMAGHNKTLYPIPERRDLTKMKEFMRMKYIQKRFLEEEDDSDESDEISSEEDRKKKSKKHKKRVKKTKKRKKKKVTSSDDESDDDSQEDNSEEEETKHQKHFKPVKEELKTGNKLGGKFTKPKVHAKSTKTTTVVKKEDDVLDILEMGSDSAPPIEVEKNGDGWANFESGTPKEKASSEDQNDLWGAFDTPTQKEKKTTNLLSNLGDLYGQAAQTQQQQMNPFGSFGQPNMGQPLQLANNFGVPPTQPPRKI